MAAPAAEPQDSTGVIPVPISLLVLPCFSWKESCMCGQRGPRDGLVAGLRRIGMTCFVHLCHRELIFCNFTVLGVKRSVSLQSPASIIITKILSGYVERVYFTAQAGCLNSLETLCWDATYWTVRCTLLNCSKQNKAPNWEHYQQSSVELPST